MKIDYASVMEITSSGLARVLSNWLEPDESKRILALENAVALLTGATTAEPSAPRDQSAHEPAAQSAPTQAPVDVPLHPPFGSRVTRTDENGVAKFLVPGTLGGRHRRGYASFGFVWIAFAGIWTSRSMVNVNGYQWILSALPFVIAGAGMVTFALSAALARLGIEIGRDGLTFTERRFFATQRTVVPLEDVGPCEIEGVGSTSREYRVRPGMYTDMRYDMRSRHSSRRPTQVLKLDIGARTLRFAENLSDREREWLRDAINEELRKARR